MCKKISNLSLCSVLILLGLTSLVYLALYHKELQAVTCINKASDLAKLFPTKLDQIKAYEAQIKAKTESGLAQILAIPAQDRTFTNTVLALDRLKLAVGNLANSIEVLKYLSPDDALRNQAQTTSLVLSSYFNEQFALNKDLYLAFLAFYNQTSKIQALTVAERYFLQETMDGFKRSGFDLPPDQFTQLKKLVQEIEELAQQYVTNQAQDQAAIVASQSELAGLPADFISKLVSDAQGNLVINCDTNNYVLVVSYAQDASLRERIYRAYTHKAYPQNEQILVQLIAKRDELAQLLGFSSYAQLDLSDQMVKSPQVAQAFLYDLLDTVRPKAQQEFSELTNNLPAGVSLIDGKLQPWDLPFVKNSYKLKNLAIDDNLVAEFFPQEHTIKKLLEIYEQFFSLRFEVKQVSGLWSPEVQVLAAYDAPTNKLLGYFLLDLAPRPNKFAHMGAQMTVIPAVLPSELLANDQNTGCPLVSVIMANFPRGIGSKPALMNYEQVRTFFHEFGHALHALFARTQLASTSGTSVKTDFVEMPSQMLELWLAEPNILHQISKHYQTGANLPAELVHKLVALQKFDTGDTISRQLALSLLALELYGPGASKDFNNMRAQISQKSQPYINYDPQNRGLANFLHIAVSNYGSKYYGYLWSRVFASDIFAELKHKGLGDPLVGKDYINKVLSKGGSCDPSDLLQDFLGRAPNQAAFKKELGV